MAARAARVPAPAESKVETPAAVKAKPVTVGKFVFEVDYGLSIPADIPKARSQNELPFKDMFEGMEHNAHRFVPQSFWTAPKEEGGRAVDPAGIKQTLQVYARTKIRDAFNQWKKRTAPANDSKSIIIVPRKAGDLEGRFKEDGMSFFVVDEKKS